MGNDMSAEQHPFAAMFKEAQTGRFGNFPGFPGMASSMPSPVFPEAFNAFFSGGASSVHSSASSTTRSSTPRAATPAQNTSRMPTSTQSVHKTDAERLDALLDAIHTEEYFDPALGQSMSAKALRTYFATAGIDKDSEGRKFVEVSDMRAAYIQRSKLGVSELRRRLQARGISCEGFIERKDFEGAFANASRLCPICINEYEAGDCVCALPCGHTYHVACVRMAAHAELEEHQRWPRCPECRNDLNKTPQRLSSGERPSKTRRC